MQNNSSINVLAYWLTRIYFTKHYWESTRGVYTI